MPFPNSAFGVVAVVVFLLPGLVFAVVRTGLRGYRADDKRIDSRVAEALVVSVVLDACYLFFVYSWIKGTIRFRHDAIEIVDPILLGLLLIGFGILVPMVLALAIYSPWRIKKRPWDRRVESEQHKEARLLRERRRIEAALEPRKFPFGLKRNVRYSRTPSAWDFGATESRPRMVRVRRASGEWIGGFYGPGSFVSTYPEPKDMFIRWPYKMSAIGEFGDPVTDSAGVWLQVADGDTVEWVEPKWKNKKKEEVDV